MTWIFDTAIMTGSVWVSLRLLALMMISCNKIEGLQLFIKPEVVINGRNFSLECKANNISANINIRDPDGNVVSCRPTGILNASCGNNPAYSINEETKTVSMTKVAAIADHGVWECTHTTSPPESTSTHIIVQSVDPLPNGNLIKNTTAEPSETIKTLTSDTFTVFYGCFSSTVKFKWTFSSVDWIVVGTNFTAMACPAGTIGYMATQTVADIWNHLKDDVKEILSVAVLTENDYEIHPSSSFDQYFFKSKHSESSKNLSAGEVAGIAIGSVGVLGCAVGIVFAYKTITGSKAKGHIK